MIVYAVGIGPGDAEHFTPKARHVIDVCDVIVGYALYIELISELLQGKQVISTGMKSELSRCKTAISEARKGKSVAVISSGDAGIYGMAALLLELTANDPQIKIEIVPGITAATAAASMLGAPLSNDFAVISLSDLLTPWSVIERRLEAAGLGDFVVCLYNPRSKTRKDGLRRACGILLKHKPPQTPCGYVRNALRDNSERRICMLRDLPDAEIDMLTTVIVGNSRTQCIGDRLVTSRGYRTEEVFQ